MRMAGVYLYTLSCGLVWCQPRIPVKLSVQLGHAGRVSSVAVSRDNRFVLTGGDHTAILWDAGIGAEIRRFEGHTGDVRCVAFSPDGRYVLTGSDDKTARLWNLHTGAEVRKFSGHANPVTSVSFSADGQMVVTSGDTTVRLWDAATGTEKSRFDTHAAPMRLQGSGFSMVRAVEDAVLSADGRFVAAASEDQTARVWNTGTGTEIGRWQHPTLVRVIDISPDSRVVVTGDGLNCIRFWDRASGALLRSLTGQGGSIYGVKFSPDGQKVLTAAAVAGNAQLWDAHTGREIRQFAGVAPLAFSRDGRFAVTSGEDFVTMWEVNTGREVRRFGRHSDTVKAMAFSRDGRLLLTGSGPEGQLWDGAASREIRRFKGHTGEVGAVAFSPDTRFAVTGGDKTVRLWDIGSGAEVRRFEAIAYRVAFSPDGKFLLTGSSNGVELREAETGTKVHQFGGLSREVKAAFSPDGRFIFAGGLGGARMWEVATQQQLQRFEWTWKLPLPGAENAGGWATAVAVSPDSRFVFAGTFDGSVRMWNAESGEQVLNFSERDLVLAVAFSADGRFILTAAMDQTAARLWNVRSGALVRSFEGHAGDIRSVAFSSDGRFVLTGSSDGTARLWDADTARLRATLISYPEGGWTVADPEGRYDASDPDYSPGLYWQAGDEVIELRQLKNRFYTPNLLARILVFNSEPLPQVAGLDMLQLWPEIQITKPAAGQSVATIRLTDRGDGAGHIVVKVNGREIGLAARNAPIQTGRAIPIDLSAAPLAANGDNTIEVVAYARDNLVASRGVRVEWNKLPEKASAPAVLHAIVAGVSDYENANLSLKYAAKDAREMARALEIGGKRLFGVKQIDIAVFAGAGREPTKENLRQAFASIADRAGPNDVVLVYLAGHGVAGKAGSDLYYYLTREARSANPDDDPQLWSATTISSSELLQWLRRKGMPLREVVVLDTCAAGAASAALIKLADRRDLTADQRRALELLKDATGSHMLMGAAADKVSYEASRYGQGLLTYSLLRGMRGEALDQAGELNVRKWFDSAQRLVPELAQGIGGVQQPVILSPAARAFRSASSRWRTGPRSGCPRSSRNCCGPAFTMRTTSTLCTWKGRCAPNCEPPLCRWFGVKRDPSQTWSIWINWPGMSPALINLKSDIKLPAIH